MCVGCHDNRAPYGVVHMCVVPAIVVDVVSGVANRILGIWKKNRGTHRYVHIRVNIFVWVYFFFYGSGWWLNWKGDRLGVYESRTYQNIVQNLSLVDGKSSFLSIRRWMYKRYLSISVSVKSIISGVTFLSPNVAHVIRLLLTYNLEVGLNLLHLLILRLYKSSFFIFYVKYNCYMPKLTLIMTQFVLHKKL